MYFLFTSIAQLVEQLTFNQLVAGSNPAGCTTFLRLVISHKRTLEDEFVRFETGGCVFIFIITLLVSYEDPQIIESEIKPPPVSSPY